METDLDALSNSVLDAIDAKNYDEAEKLCRRLLLEYPKELDGHDRLATLREAQGRFKEAAEEYSKVLQMIALSPGRTDQEMVQYIKERRDRALEKADG